MEQSSLRAFEAQCTQEEPPACQTMCPLHVEVRAFIKHMAEGRFADARKLLDRGMPLPGLIGRLCSGPCTAHCRRAELDGGVNMPLLERACVTHTAPARPLALPATGKRVAVAGAGLSSLALAFELGKKGHLVTLCHTGAFGATLPELLRGAGVADVQTVLDEAREQLAAVRVAIRPVDEFSPDWRAGAPDECLALYLGLDDPGVTLNAFGLESVTDALTGQTTDAKIFAGGAGLANRADCIRAAADGKRAAGSVTRLLQGVNPATAREHEDTYPSVLFTDISTTPPAPPVAPLDQAAPDEEEARTEARRCIQCECLECVKHCVYLARYKGYPKRYAREMYNNLSIVHGLRRANTQIDSCAECGLCAAICPNNADMGAFCAAARREMVRARRMPPSAHEFALEDMAYSNSPDIAFFRHAPGSAASAWALFPGCQLPASLPEQTNALYAHLRAHLDGGVGLFFHCCGAPARWSGREQLTAASAAAVRALWEEGGKPTLLLACASCTAFFAAELPDIPARSLWEVLATLPLPPAAAAATFPLALHDPCAARDLPGVQAAVRAALGAIGQESRELPLGRELTRCCGYGGLADAANPAMGEAYARSRAEDTQNPLLAYCIMCRDRLAAVGKPALHLLDLLFPLLPAGQALTRPAPGISARQETRLAFRRDLLQALWNDTPARNPAMDAIILDIPDDTARKLEARRILHTDIKAVLLHARDNGAQFHNPATGRSLACLRPRQVTFWVEYSPAPNDGYLIHDAYCHRMLVPGTPGRGLPTAAILEGHNPKGGRV